MNKGQEQAILEIARFRHSPITRDVKSRWLGLCGKAGTGKTYVTRSIEANKGINHDVIGCAFSHSAKEILQANLGIECITIAQLLFYVKKGNKFESKMSSWPFANRYKLIICDEASTLSKEQRDLINQIYPLSKILCIGDKGQLGPISKESFCIFDEIPTIELTENMRMGENPMSELHDLVYMKNIPIDINDMKDNIVDGKGYAFISNIEALNLLATTDAVSISFSNYIRKQVNERVHKTIYGEDCYDWYKNQKIISYENLDYVNHRPTIYNSEIVTINNIIGPTVLQIDFYHYLKDHKLLKNVQRYWAMVYNRLELITGNGCPGNRVNINVLNKGDEFYNDLVYFINNKLWSIYCVNDENKKEYYNLKKFVLSYFNEVDYKHAITSHKVQGATFEAPTIVWLSDIMECKIPNNVKSQAFYTAITRSKNLTYIVR